MRRFKPCLIFQAKSYISGDKPIFTNSAWVAIFFSVLMKSWIPKNVFIS